MPLDIAQIAFPLRVVNGQIHTVEQGGAEDARSQTYVLVSTPLGWMASAPDFGLAEQAHLEGGPDVDEIERQITEYVPDAVAAVDADRDALNPYLALLGVRIGAA